MNFRKNLTNSKKEAVLAVAGVGRACCRPPLAPTTRSDQQRRRDGAGSVTDDSGRYSLLSSLIMESFLEEGEVERMEKGEKEPEGKQK